MKYFCFKIPIITHFTKLVWITHKHQTPLLQCFFTQNWWLNFPASVNVSAANWSWLTVKLILHPWTFPSFSCSSMTQQKQKTDLMHYDDCDGRRVRDAGLAESVYPKPFAFAKEWSGTEIQFTEEGQLLAAALRKPPEGWTPPQEW